MLTPDLRASITMMMRVVNHLQNNLHIIRDNAVMMDSLAALKENIAAILELLSEEDRDSLLDQYKEEALFLGLSK